MASYRGRPWIRILSLAMLVVLFAGAAHASKGDRLEEFRQCLEVCRTENCGPGKTHTPIPLSRRILLWDCTSECDYTCQHIITNRRRAVSEPALQFHGKWPFYRVLGMQEACSVIFSLANLWAHWEGLKKVQAQIPASYTMRPFYMWFARMALISWTCSTVFHTRDFQLTEELDYFAAGASVMYGLYYTTVRMFRLDRRTPRRKSLLRSWTLICALMYICHVAFLKLVRWDYTYNMTANVTIGIIQNSMWTYFSYDRYRKSRRAWATYPGIAVAWVTFAMSMELFDFPPWLGLVDAHSLWHLMTIGPAILWYNFLVMDAQDDIGRSERLKA